MRRARLLIDTSSWKRNYGYFDLFKSVEWARVMRNLTLTQHQFVDLWEVRFLPGRSPPDLVGSFGIEAATPAGARGGRTLLVVRAPFHGFLKKLYFEYGVTFEPPLEFRREAVRVTLLGSDTAMSRALAYLRRSRFRFETLSAGAFEGESGDALGGLTVRQREVTELAFLRGYFDVPSKTTARRLAKELRISHQAVVDTLHRAERRILSALLAAQPSRGVTK